MTSIFNRFNSDHCNDYVLEASVDNTRNLAQLLKAIHFRDVAIVCATSDGLKVTVEDTKSVQGNAYIQSALFHDYNVKKQSVIFKVNLSVLLECLNIFGTKNNPGSIATVKICYSGYGSPLVLLIEENGVVTDCKLQTLEPEDILDFEFTPSKVVNKIIMQSEILKEAWSDLDMNSEVLEILMSPSEPYFQLTTKGSLATIHINISKDSDMIESFECTDEVKNRYQIFLIKPSLRALVQSSKVSIRIDDRGFLCMQYMIKVEGLQCCFVEYLCSPNIDDD
ncbi:cell cycle checkpoint protein RAD1 [Parasteatoda tepidariorum]|uniref:cell cycle checkpoint protein RAD1 n=1 Tax=Parasteatoda tepidariorum TaxID=114398 RepID=UPI000A2C03C4|nr:cell cycle checkpoint protein RAD1 [Parasteatoda tepidariorum]